jgi:hypothetical protein
MGIIRHGSGRQFGLRIEIGLTGRWHGRHWVSRRNRYAGHSRSLFCSTEQRVWMLWDAGSSFGIIKKKSPIMRPIGPQEQGAIPTNLFPRSRVIAC